MKFLYLRDNALLQIVRCEQPKKKNKLDKEKGDVIFGMSNNIVWVFSVRIEKVCIYVGK